MSSEKVAELLWIETSEDDTVALVAVGAAELSRSRVVVAGGLVDGSRPGVSATVEELLPELAKLGAVAATPESKVPDLVEPCGKNVLEESSQEFRALQPHREPVLPVSVTVLEGDLLVR